MANEPESSNAEARLWRLIEERGKPDARVDESDRRIWELFGE